MRRPRLVVLAFASLLAAGCGGGGAKEASDPPGPCAIATSSGTLEFSHGGTTSKVDCFTGGLVSQNAGIYIESPSPTTMGTLVVMNLNLLATNDETSAPCNWQVGASVPLTDGCFTMSAFKRDFGAALYTTVWNAVAGGGTQSLMVNYPDAPLPTGSVTVTQWPSSAGQPAEIKFSSDAALTLPPNLEANTGMPPGLVPLSGSAGIVTM